MLIIPDYKWDIKSTRVILLKTIHYYLLIMNISKNIVSGSGLCYNNILKYICFDEERRKTIEEKCEVFIYSFLGIGDSK